MVQLHGAVPSVAGTLSKPLAMKTTVPQRWTAAPEAALKAPAPTTSLLNFVIGEGRRAQRAVAAGFPTLKLPPLPMSRPVGFPPVALPPMYTLRGSVMEKAPATESSLVMTTNELAAVSDRGALTDRLQLNQIWGAVLRDGLAAKKAATLLQSPCWSTSHDAPPASVHTLPLTTPQPGGLEPGLVSSACASSSSAVTLAR